MCVFRSLKRRQSQQLRKRDRDRRLIDRGGGSADDAFQTRPDKAARL